METFDIRLVTDNGGKVKVMELLSHESSEVRYQALITVCIPSSSLAYDAG